MNNWQNSKLNQRSRSKSKVQAKKVHARYVFSPHRSSFLTTLLGKAGYSRRSKSSFKIVEYNFNVEYGVRLKPHSTGWLRSVVVITGLMTMLPLLWWLNSSNASIVPLSSESGWFSSSTTPEDLSPSNFSPTSFSAPIVASFAPSQPSAPTPTNKSKLSYPILKPQIPPLPWLHLTIQSGENLALIFKKHELNKEDLYQIVNLEQYAQQLRQLHLNQELHIKHDLNGNIENVILTLNETDELYIYKIGDEKFSGEIRRIGVQIERIAVNGKVETSLAAAAQEAKLSSKLLAQLVELFSWDIDFDRDIQPGDQFTVIYEQRLFEGEREESDILAAEFINQGEVHRALRYTTPSNYTDYYTPMGDSLRKISLLSAPVEYTRVSSLFGERKHPIFRRYNFHTGIDYAAPYKTPIVAGGNGTVLFVGRKGGYGKTIILKHHERVKTLYAHLSKFAEDIKVGESVIQGQIIGYVGRTGRATGPHLHYEVQVDEIPTDPQQLINSPLSMPIVEENQFDFILKTQKCVVQLEAMNSVSPPAVVKISSEPPRQFSSTSPMKKEGREVKLPSKLTQQVIPVESSLKQHSNMN